MSERYCAVCITWLWLVPSSMMRLTAPRSTAPRSAAPRSADCAASGAATAANAAAARKKWRMKHRSEEHTPELKSLIRISYAVFGLKKTKTTHIPKNTPLYTTSEHHTYVLD